MAYYECRTCCYATNSERRADDHMDDIGHTVSMTYADAEDPRIAAAEYERDHGHLDEPPAGWEP